MGWGEEVAKREAGDPGIRGDRHCGPDWWKEGEAGREMRALKGKASRREEKDEPRGKAGVVFIA